MAFLLFFHPNFVDSVAEGGRGKRKIVAPDILAWNDSFSRKKGTHFQKKGTGGQ